jgi:aminoglycoside phosphotransferase (APT) family kinase protein
VSDLDIEADLRSWAVAETGDADASIEGLVRTSAGFSRENWVFDLVSGGERRPLIARRDPVGSVLETDREVETAVLRALAGTRVPVAVPAPVVVWSDPHGERLGRPTVVMERAEGVCDWFVLTGDRPLETRVEIAHRLYDRMADIHRFDWRAAGLGAVLDDPGPAAATAAVDLWEDQLRRVQLEPEPELELILAWLRTHAPTSPVTTLVHADFKPGNTLLTGDEVSLVLDWETAHLGDPHEDLGWVTNPVRAGEHRIPDVWQPDDLLARWSARTGIEVDRASVHWWNVLANLKLCVIVLTGTRAFVDGRLDRVHQPPLALGRVMLDMIGA